MATPAPAQNPTARTKPTSAQKPVVSNNPIAEAGSSAVTSVSNVSEEKDLVIDESHASLFDAGTSTLMDSMTKLLFEGTSILSNLNPEAFEMFGKMSSHEYRKLFFKVTKDLDNSCRVWIIILFTAIKSKPRVLNAMPRFNKEPWYAMTRDFIIQKMVQYTKELPADNSKFAAVHVPHIMPSFTAICWVKITKVSERTPENFLKNLWACQMDLPTELMEFQKKWEVNFWDGTVTISRNVTRDAVPLEFHENFWATKAADKYPFYNSDGKLFKVNNMEDLKKWIDQWSAYSARS